MTRTERRRRAMPHGSKLWPLLVALAAGCDPTPAGGTREDGSVHLSVSAGSAEVASAVVTIRAGGGDDFHPIVITSNRAGESWSIAVSSVPAGIGRLFEVAALDALGTPILAGTARADVLAGGVTAVTVLLQPTAPPPLLGQAAPVVDAIWAAPAVVEPGGVAQLGASAHDPDPGDAVSYYWTATCGTFDDPSLPTVRWTAPPASGITCVAVVSVSDRSGIAVRTSLALFVP